MRGYAVPAVPLRSTAGYHPSSLQEEINVMRQSPMENGDDAKK